VCVRVYVRVFVCVCARAARASVCASSMFVLVVDGRRA